MVFLLSLGAKIPAFGNTQTVGGNIRTTQKMNRLLWILLVVLLTISCDQTTSNNSVDKDTLIVRHDNLTQAQDTTKHSNNNFNSNVAQVWTDSLIQNYINNSDNPLIGLSLKNKISEQWLFDQTISTDTANYLVFQIGHDESDKGGKINVLLQTNGFI